ncbi:hypothetical protein RHGRI_012000 [Rhododendron griersonianum]|uniref:Uncharacterized protein n=1 Tax=Rhododendron griersonianum TaxID=479676 RepID=A0AAV6K7S2_9ERIC|nr:hypothetical protein RHGRI_035467 [Rhododendron griersonianum]KAG5531857.1 hypothetical protein RHGRI_026461 [Rhododendron griersonianum]KAG5548343.1 hypothetical protein RHGRI_013892 [Rhododendron griersonianum]KAG5554330.1 hypothetical protein RHGRI_012000 [Rhododendron griersonianum]
MKTYEVGFKGLKRIGEVGVLNTLGIGEVGILNTLDEPGKQMRSDVRIKNTSSSHVASSPSGSDSDADDAESRG